MPHFDPESMLRILADHHVEYVLIGGLAATLHGSPHRSITVDGRPHPERRYASRRRIPMRYDGSSVTSSKDHGARPAG
jgi:hypothetical protein